MALTGKQARYLRGLGHHLDAVVIVGQAGATDAVVAKIAVELENHELIKIRVHDGPVSARELATTLAERSGSDVAQVLGKTVLLYKRRKDKPEIRLPVE